MTWLAGAHSLLKRALVQTANTVESLLRVEEIWQAKVEIVLLNGTIPGSRKNAVLIEKAMSPRIGFSYTTTSVL